MRCWKSDTAAARTGGRCSPQRKSMLRFLRSMTLTAYWFHNSIVGHGFCCQRRLETCFEFKCLKQTVNNYSWTIPKTQTQSWMSQRQKQHCQRSNFKIKKMKCNAPCTVACPCLCVFKNSLNFGLAIPFEISEPHVNAARWNTKCMGGACIAALVSKYNMHGKKLIVQISLNRFHNICCIKCQLCCLPFANWTSAVAKVTSVPSAGMWILLLVPLNHFSCQLPVHVQILWVQSVSLEHQNPTSLFGTLLQNSSAILFHLLLVFCFCTGRPCSAYNCDIVTSTMKEE